MPFQVDLSVPGGHQEASITVVFPRGWGGAPGWRAGLLQRPGVLPGGDPIPVLSVRAVGPVCLSDKVSALTPRKKKADPLRVPLGAVRSSPPGLVPGQARCGHGVGGRRGHPIP